MITSTDAAPDLRGGAVKQARQASPAYLAFLGDAVYSLMVRERIIRTGGPVGRAHSRAARLVCAAAQARAAAFLAPFLTEEEADMLRRGRNLHTRTAPKGSTCAEYHAATGLEALFGFLYLSGQERRLRELMDRIWEDAARARDPRR